jgi:alkyl sulfatase BDS1-like metallo-beta-lactamase superfamily hydrolase
MTQNDGGYNFLDPTTIYTEDKVTRTIDGVNIELIRAPGETDDQIYVYLPDFKAICTGDNYYGVFPNLYAIRGTQYRDIAQWVSSLRSILDYDVEAMLPGHTAPIIGKENIINRVTSFAGAIEGVLMDTLDCMNKGMTLSETVETVKLRPEYENCDFLGEFYGTVQWAVRSVYTGYVGWFDGSPSKLLPLSDREYNSELLSLIGEEKLEAKIDECLTNGNFQLALQFLDIKDNPEKRKSALLGRATEVTSANARHYLMGWAKFNLNL